jgi:beta-lactamase regulating signal transducer with metallopeptidase domain
MTAEAILSALLRPNLVASGAIVLVLAVRPLVLRRLGGRIAYWLWLVVPMAAAASLLPARVQIVVVPPPSVETLAPTPAEPVADSQPVPEESAARAASARSVVVPGLAELLVALWLIGAGALLTRSIVCTRRLAADPSLGPALVGVLRPKLLLPVDFDTRFHADERALILAHEEVHRLSGHTVVNALVELARCVSWFNPLAHVAARACRADQELACDATVIAARPSARRIYAEALLKTQIGSAYLPIGCTWTSRSARLLGERIAMLGRPTLCRRELVAGASTVVLAGLALGYAAWAQQPERLVTQVARPEAVFTPAAEAPEGTLTHALEGKRHDFFIELAQAGDIDLVFFGTTDTEMWWWDRGKSVWNREFGSLKAANFGSQGTQPRSLLWRIRNGELDGYAAKLIVLQVGPIESWIPDDDRADFLDGFRPIIAEMRARQPQAKLLLMAPLPRGGSLEQWRKRSVSVDSTFAELVDNETVFYANFGASFYNDDGSFKRETWSTGRQAPGFEIWAQDLQPWLDRFVR